MLHNLFLYRCKNTAYFIYCQVKHYCIEVYNCFITQHTSIGYEHRIHWKWFQNLFIINKCIHRSVAIAFCERLQSLMFLDLLCMQYNIIGIGFFKYSGSICNCSASLMSMHTSCDNLSPSRGSQSRSHGLELPIQALITDKQLMWKCDEADCESLKLHSLP